MTAMLFVHRCVRCVYGTLLVVVIFCGSASAQINVRPIKLLVPSQSRGEIITLSNIGQAPRKFEVLITAWRQQGQEDVLTPSEALIVSPPLFTLSPNKPQVLRVLRSGPPDESKELSFRLLINEIVNEKVPGANGQPRLALNMSLPVFLSPLTPTAPDYAIQLTDRALADPQSRRKLVIENRGFVHVQSSQLTLLKDNVELGDSQALFGYALPGESKVWELDSSRLGAATAIRIRLTNGAVHDIALDAR